MQILTILVKSSYDALYTNDDAGDQARKKDMESKFVQLQLGPTWYMIGA